MQMLFFADVLLWQMLLQAIFISIVFLCAVIAVRAYMRKARNAAWWALRSGVGLALGVTWIWLFWEMISGLLMYAAAFLALFSPLVVP